MPDSKAREEVCSASRHRDGASSGGKSCIAKAKAIRKTVLEAALQLVSVKGVAVLTIGKAVSRSGCFEGGMLYNSPSKKTFACAMLKPEAIRISGYGAKERGRQLVSHPPTVLALADVVECWIKKDDIGFRGILLAHVNAPDFCAPVRTVKDRLREQMLVRPGSWPRIQTIWIALEDLMTAFAHRLMRLSDDELKCVFDEPRPGLRFVPD